MSYKKDHNCFVLDKVFPIKNLKNEIKAVTHVITGMSYVNKGK